MIRTKAMIEEELKAAHRKIVFLNRELHMLKQYVDVLKKNPIFHLEEIMMAHAQALDSIAHIATNQDSIIKDLLRMTNDPKT